MHLTCTTIRKYASIGVSNYLCLLIWVTLTSYIPATGNGPSGNKLRREAPTHVPALVRGAYWSIYRFPALPRAPVIASDPIRFTIQCSKPTIRVGEPIDLIITAELLNISPNVMFFLPGSNSYSLKMLLPPGFVQTGGDFSDYVTGELYYPSQPLKTYTIQGYFQSMMPGTGFRLLRGQTQQATGQGLFVERARVDLKAKTDNVATKEGRAGLVSTTLYVIADNNNQSARSQATTDPLTMLTPTYNCATGAISFNVSGGDGTVIRYRSIGITDWTTNPNQFLDVSARVDADTPPFAIYVEQSGKTFIYTWSRQLACSTTTPPTTVTTTPPATPANPLTVLAPTYDCATGAITFRTSGGDGTTIRYLAAGITSWTTNPNQFLDAGSRTAADTPPFTIYVEQSGRTASYTWSRQSVCSTTTPPTTVTTTPPTTVTTTPPTTVTTTPASALTVLVQTYNCTTGAIAFNTSGGDGTTIRYLAAGITGWTTNPNQFLDAGSRTAADTPPFTIYVEQSGRITSYTWSRQTACSTTTPPVTVTVTPPVTTPSPTTSATGCVNFGPLCSGNIQEVRTVTINVATAGSYSVVIGYSAREGTVDGIVRINGAQQNLRFDRTSGNGTVTTPLVTLKAGDNVIDLSSGAGGGFLCFNSVCLGSPPPPPSCAFTTSVNSVNATCSQQALQLTATCVGSDCAGVTYNWSGNGLSYTGQSVYFDALPTNGVFTYTVTASLAGCADKRATGTVTVTGCDSTPATGVCTINDYSAETDINYIP